MSFLEITVTGAADLALKLQGVFGEELVTQILDDATAAVLARIRARYLEKVDTDGLPWKPSQAGLDREAVGGPGTLFDTGNLFHSIQEVATDKTNERLIATDVFYGPFLQFGTKFMPAREFLGIGEEDEKVIEAIINTRVERALAKFNE